MLRRLVNSNELHITLVVPPNTSRAGEVKKNWFFGNKFFVKIK
jgi:hypothetical protein